MNGFIVVNKESGMTSRDVVNKLNKILNTKKIGHTGTLDPLAKGVLVLCVGSYTKMVLDITGYDKTYIATVKLGISTDTLDITGNVLEERDYIIDKEKIEEVVNSFKGSYNQEVPIYSSVKINGKKLYEYARNNEEVVLPKREVFIKDIKLLEIFEDGFSFEASVSKGTYIRSLIKDICDKLNLIGTMSDLIRTKQGNFLIENSFTLKDIENGNYNFLNLEDVIDYEIINLTDEEFFKVKNGAKINKEISDGKYILNYNNENIAIYEFVNNIGIIHIMFDNK